MAFYENNENHLKASKLVEMNPLNDLCSAARELGKLSIGCDVDIELYTKLSALADKLNMPQPKWEKDNCIELITACNNDSARAALVLGMLQKEISHSFALKQGLAFFASSTLPNTIRAMVDASTLDDMMKIVNERPQGFWDELKRDDLAKEIYALFEKFQETKLSFSSECFPAFIEIAKTQKLREDLKLLLKEKQFFQLTHESENNNALTSN